MAMTYLGSAIWSYKRLSTGAILFTMVPEMMIRSACRGVALVTSKPKREKSYLADAADIISIAQQLVPKTNGQSELLRAQLITSSNGPSITPPPGVSCTVPGNNFLASVWISLITVSVNFEL